MGRIVVGYLSGGDMEGGVNIKIQDPTLHTRDREFVKAGRRDNGIH